MKALTPHQVHDYFSTAFNAGDLVLFVSLYERDAILVLTPLARPRLILRRNKGKN